MQNLQRTAEIPKFYTLSVSMVLVVQPTFSLKSIIFVTYKKKINKNERMGGPWEVH